MITPIFTAETYACSDVGKIRAINQDACLVADLTQGTYSGNALSQEIGPQGGLFIVADGVGGGSSGEIASQLAVETLYEVLSKTTVLDPSHALESAVQRAHHRIQAYAEEHRIDMMGTTATVVMAWQNRLITAQVGDSRAYLMRNGDLVQITHDQSLVDYLVQEGLITRAQAQTHPQRNVILQCLGLARDIEVVINEHLLEDQDILLLCSDGLHGMIDHNLMENIISSKPVEGAVRELIDQSNAHGGRDNITAVLTRFSQAA